MSERPDVISDVLEVSGLRTLYFSRFEVGAPWALAVPTKPTSSFYVVLERQMRVAIDERETMLETGDLVLLPHGVAHRLDDGSARGGRTAPRTRGSTVDRLEIPGGADALATFVSGCFRFVAGATHPVLRSLPEIVHFRAAEAGPVFEAIVRVVALASREPGPGSHLSSRA